MKDLYVKGCYNASFYSSNCDTPCPTNCKDNTCHIQSGACFSCISGWTDVHCDICKITLFINYLLKTLRVKFLFPLIILILFQYFIQASIFKCSNCLFYRMCRRTARYNCSQQRVGHCRGRALCNHVTGQCDTGYDAGWKGVMCDKGIWFEFNYNYSFSSQHISEILHMNYFSDNL